MIETTVANKWVWVHARDVRPGDVVAFARDNDRKWHTVRTVLFGAEDNFGRECVIIGVSDDPSESRDLTHDDMVMFRTNPDKYQFPPIWSNDHVRLEPDNEGDVETFMGIIADFARKQIRVGALREDEKWRYVLSLAGQALGFRSDFLVPEDYEVIGPDAYIAKDHEHGGITND